MHRLHAPLVPDSLLPLFLLKHFQSFLFKFLLIGDSLDLKWLPKEPIMDAFTGLLASSFIVVLGKSHGNLIESWFLCHIRTRHHGFFNPWWREFGLWRFGVLFWWGKMGLLEKLCVRGIWEILTLVNPLSRLYVPHRWIEGPGWRFRFRIRGLRLYHLHLSADVIVLNWNLIIYWLG